ncbi:MAG: beta-lactamase family protein [Marinicaulis sp.]|nr:beta-lactamase family protein [Marinicaulis sp.]
MRKNAVIFVCSLFLISCSTSGGPQIDAAGWPEWVNAKDAGFSKDGLTELDSAVDAGNTQSMIVVSDGRVVYSYGDVSRTEGSYIASVRKSLLSILYGIYEARGEIELNVTLADLGIDDVKGLTDREKRATLHDIISARSGIFHPASNASGVTEADPKRGDHGPGTYYWYNNWDFNAAGGIFEKITGRDIYDAFNDHLAKPLGMEDFDLAIHKEKGKSGDLTKSTFPAYHFYSSTRDLARIGQLMIDNGEWRGERIVSQEWVERSTAAITPNSDMNPERYRESGFGYGYMWWVMDDAHFPPAYHGGYAARGHFGQYIVVLPAVDLVIAHKTLPVRYKTPEEYEAINVTWDEMRVLVDLALTARLTFD